MPRALQGFTTDETFPVFVERPPQQQREQRRKPCQCPRRTPPRRQHRERQDPFGRRVAGGVDGARAQEVVTGRQTGEDTPATVVLFDPVDVIAVEPSEVAVRLRIRSEEHTSELQSLMRISYAVVCLKKK